MNFAIQHKAKIFNETEVKFAQMIGKESKNNLQQRIIVHKIFDCASIDELFGLLHIYLIHRYDIL